jgi:hypothetical protein
MFVHLTDLTDTLDITQTYNLPLEDIIDIRKKTFDDLGLPYMTDEQNYDLELNNLIVKNVNIPCLALGGAGNWNHILQLFKKTNISAACTQNIYHFTNESLKSAKEYLEKNKVLIRQ